MRESERLHHSVLANLKIPRTNVSPSSYWLNEEALRRELSWKSTERLLHSNQTKLRTSRRDILVESLFIFVQKKRRNKLISIWTSYAKHRNFHFPYDGNDCSRSGSQWLRTAECWLGYSLLGLNTVDLNRTSVYRSRTLSDCTKKTYEHFNISAKIIMSFNRFET